MTVVRSPVARDQMAPDSMVHVPPKADPFVQRRLLDVARIDQTTSAATHRRTTLPELALIAAGAVRVD